MMFSERFWIEDEPKSATLVFVKISGPNSGSECVDSLIACFRAAAGMIVLLDPLQFEGVRGIVGAQNEHPDLKFDHMPANLILNLTDRLVRAGVISGKGRFDTPTAFTLTKADILRDSGLIPKDARWNQPDFHEGYFDISLHEAIEANLRALFRTYEPAALNNIEVRFEHSAFFAVSSTGSSPHSVTHRYPPLRPWRVEEPLLWLLARLGVVPMRRSSDSGRKDLA